MKTSQIKFTVTVDDNNLPHKIEWEAEEAGEKSSCKSVMMAIWDEHENSTLRIDLWTKNMMVDEMKKFYHQNVMTLTDAYARATGDDAVAKEIKEFFEKIGKKQGVLN